MVTAEELLHSVDEATFTIQRIKQIRDGRLVIRQKRKYAGPAVRDGFKRNPQTGAVEKMTMTEHRKRSKAVRRVQRKASVKLKRQKSIRRREAMGL